MCPKSLPLSLQTQLCCQGFFSLFALSGVKIGQRCGAQTLSIFGEAVGCVRATSEGKWLLTSVNITHSLFTNVWPLWAWSLLTSSSFYFPVFLHSSSESCQSLGSVLGLSHPAHFLSFLATPVAQITTLQADNIRLYLQHQP